MNFRELTNTECQNSREWIPEQAKRTALESQVLSCLQSDIDAFLQSGGTVQKLPPMKLSHTDSYKAQTLSKASETARKNAKKAREGV